eukprot:12934246-Prorocentrum_lima.AAC.1
MDMQQEKKKRKDLAVRQLIEWFLYSDVVAGNGHPISPREVRIMSRVLITVLKDTLALRDSFQ